MKRAAWGWLIAIIGIGLIAFFGWPRIQDEYANAVRRSVDRDLEEIRLGVRDYVRVNHKFPESVQLLVPKFLPPQVIHRPARFDLKRQSLLVPSDPYQIRDLTNDFELTCVFKGTGYARVVMDRNGEIRTE